MGGKWLDSDPLPRSAGIALTVNPVFTEELVMSDLKELGLIQPSALEAAIAQSGAASSALTKPRCSAGQL